MGSTKLARTYEPGVWAPRISPTPLLMIVVSHDTTPTDLALASYEQALKPKKLVLIPGGHFGPYISPRRRCGIEPHLHHRAVDNEPDNVFIRQRTAAPGLPIGLHLSPDPAHRIPDQVRGRLFDTAPLNSAASARRTRPVLVPAGRRQRSVPPQLN